MVMDSFYLWKIHDCLLCGSAGLSRLVAACLIFLSDLEDNEMQLAWLNGGEQVLCVCRCIQRHLDAEIFLSFSMSVSLEWLWAPTPETLKVLNFKAMQFAGVANKTLFVRLIKTTMRSRTQPNCWDDEPNRPNRVFFFRRVSQTNDVTVERTNDLTRVRNVFVNIKRFGSNKAHPVWTFNKMLLHTSLTNVPATKSLDKRTRNRYKRLENRLPDFPIFSSTLSSSSAEVKV